MSALKVAIEGPDLSGKSTLVESVYDVLTMRGYKVKVVHFPRYEQPIGFLIKKILSEDIDIESFSFQSLYSADMNDFCNNKLKELEEEYDVLLFDRYYHSTIVFSQALGLSFEQQYILTKDLERPDLLINIKSEIDVFVERLIKRSDEPDKLEKNNKFIKNTIARYQNLEETIQSLNTFGENTSFSYKPYTEEIKAIDTKQSPEEILTQALFIIDQQIELKNIKSKQRRIKNG